MALSVQHLNSLIISEFCTAKQNPVHYLTGNLQSNNSVQEWYGTWNIGTLNRKGFKICEHGREELICAAKKKCDGENVDLN